MEEFGKDRQAHYLMTLTMSSIQSFLNLQSPDKYDINGINIPLAKHQPEQHVSSSPSTPTGGYSHIRRGSMKLIFPKLFHWRKLTDKKNLIDARNKFQRLSLRSATSTNVA